MTGKMTSTNPGLNRRAALGGVGVAAAAIGLSKVHRATAQEAADLANHPLTGTWAAMTPGGVVPQTHGADGSFIAAFPPNYVDPMTGLTFQGPALGRWESTGERTGQFTFIQALSDSDGVYIGTFQLSGGIEASEDGQSWVGYTPPRAIVRDATNTVTFDQELPIEPAVTGARIGATPELIVIPVATPAAGTPTA